MVIIPHIDYQLSMVKKLNPVKEAVRKVQVLNEEINNLLGYTIE